MTASRSAVAASTPLSCAMMIASRSAIGIIERDRDEALARARLQILQHALIAGVVRNHEQEIGMRGQQLAGLFDRQHSPMIGQRMDDDGRVLARLDDLVQIADRARAHRARQRTIHPHRFVAAQQIAADEIGRGEVFVTADGNQRFAEQLPRRLLLAVQPPRHVFDEARLAASGRAFQQHRQSRFVGRFEYFEFVADRQVVGLGVRVPRLLAHGTNASRPRWNVTNV